MRLVTKVTSLVQVLQSGGSYAFDEKLWCQFVLTADNINVEVVWNRHEVLVSSIWSQKSFCDFPDLHCWFAFTLSSWMECCHRFYHVQSRGRRLTNCIAGSFKSNVWPCGHFSGLGTETISVVWQFVCKTGSEVTLPVNCLSLDPLLLLLVAHCLQLPSLDVFNFPVGTYAEYLGKGYTERLVEYPTYDLRLQKRCPKKVVSSVFGCLDPISTTKFIINRLEGAEHRNSMLSRSSIRGAIIINDLQMPSPVEVDANNVDVWPLIVSYLKETGKKTVDDGLVVKHIL